MTQAEFDILTRKAVETSENFDEVIEDVVREDSFGGVLTAKAERRQKEREGISSDEELSPAEKRSLDAEKRAAWRKARLKSLENVISTLI